MSGHGGRLHLHRRAGRLAAFESVSQTGRSVVCVVTGTTSRLPPTARPPDARRKVSRHGRRDLDDPLVAPSGDARRRDGDQVRTHTEPLGLDCRRHRAERVSAPPGASPGLQVMLSKMTLTTEDGGRGSPRPPGSITRTDHAQALPSSRSPPRQSGTAGATEACSWHVSFPQTSGVVGARLVVLVLPD